MSTPATTTVPFDAVAPTYDATFTESLIGQAQRRQVQRIADRAFEPGQRVLVLNCGTGSDAAHLAQRGIDVLATDASSEMIAIARERCRHLDKVRFQVCNIEDLSAIRGQFDGVFSNFSGINCISDLETFGEDLARLVRPDGRALLCVFGCFCAWETAWYLSRVEFGKAFRRLTGKARAHFASPSIDVHYWRVRELQRALMPWFELYDRQGIGILVPPSYAEATVKRRPRMLRTLEAADEKLAALPLLRACADHAVLAFRRTNVKG